MEDDARPFSENSLKSKEIMKRNAIIGAVKAAIVTLGVAVVYAAKAQPAPPLLTPTNAPPWTGSVAAGATLTRGNSDTTVATVNFDAKRKWADQELILEADGTYGDNDNVKNAESVHGSVQYNRDVTKRPYYGIKVDALNDEIAEIDYRLTISPLVGYYLIKGTNDQLAVEAGPSFVLQKLGPTTRGYATLRLAEKYEHKFGATARFWESFEILPQVDKFNNYYWDAEAGVESGLTKKTSLRVYLDDTYYNIPATGRLKNDAKLVAAVAYKF